MIFDDQDKLKLELQTNYRLLCVPLRLNQVHKLISCALIISEDAQHGACGYYRALFLNASHHHTQMPGFDHHTDALRFETFH